MADAVAPAPAGAGQEQPAGPANSVMGLIMRMGVMWLIMSFMNRNAKPKDMSNFFQCNVAKGDLVNMQVYVSTRPDQVGRMVWEEDRLPLASWKAPYRKSVNLTTEELAPIIHENATAYLTAYFTRPASEADAAPTDPSAPVDLAKASPTGPRPALSFHVQTRLVSHRPPPKEKTGKFLLGDKSDKPDAAAEAAPAALLDDSPPPLIEEGDEAYAESLAGPPRPWIPYWKPNLTIAVVNEFDAHPNNKLPAFFDKHARLDLSTQTYYPVVVIDEFWLLKDYMIPLNESVTTVPLHLELSTMAAWWLQMEMAMDQSFELQRSGGMMQDAESDELKRIFIEGNPYLLALTTVVSVLHSVFDMLAFKNDIGFWQNNKSMEGLSARTILINAVCQLIIFLYLLDNKTSYVVLFSSGIGMLIEFWKVTKAMNVSVEMTPGGLPRLKMQDRGSYVVSKTKQYDDEAMRYLSWVLFPLVVGYSGYSLMYSEQKSWYSWALGSLVGCVYTFGFVLMCPQLYLNYKLKSVAHLPWRQMTYKFLNTIIDDLFAFVIKMPTLHRLSVFRDDLVFLILIYQRWIYPVDKSRVNEFGYSDEQPAGEQAAAIEGDAAAAEGDGAAVCAAGEPAARGSARKDATAKQAATADTASAAEAAGKQKAK